MSNHLPLNLPPASHIAETGAAWEAIQMMPGSEVNNVLQNEATAVFVVDKSHWY